MKVYGRKGLPQIAGRVFWVFCMVMMGVAGGSQSMPNFEWALGFGGAGEDFSRGIAVDRVGDCYVTGSFSGTADFEGRVLTSRGAADFFLARISRAGAVEWAVQGGSDTAATEEGRAIALDGFGNLYLTGGFAGTATFGQTNLVSAGGLDVFLAKYNQAGELAWVRSYGGGADFEYGLSVALDSAGSILLSGQFQGNATFGATNLSSRGGLDGFLAKCSLQGDVLWVTQLGGSQNDVARTVAVGPDGSSHVSGWYAGSATFGGSTALNSSGSNDAFAAKYDAAGNVIWVRTLATSRNDLAYGLSLDAQTNAYFLAWTDVVGGSQLVLRKFSPAGVVQWNRSMRVNSDGSARGWIVTDPAGNSHLAGQFAGISDFAGRFLQSEGLADAFVARFDSDGEMQWVEAVGGPGTKEIRGIAVDGKGSSCVTGRFNVSASFDAFGLATAGQGDVFVARLHEPPLLKILLDGESVLVSWPSSAWRMRLQASSSLTPEEAWEDVSLVPATMRGLIVVRDDLISSNRFYRLREP